MAICSDTSETSFILCGVKCIINIKARLFFFYYGIGEKRQIVKLNVND